MNEARREIDRMLAAARPMAEIEERIDQLPIGKEAKATLWFHAHRLMRGRRRAETSWVYRQLGGELPQQDFSSAGRGREDASRASFQ